MRELELTERLKAFKRQGDLSGAENLLNSWADLTGLFRDRWHAAMVLYYFAISEGYLEKAEVYARQLVDLDPNEASAHHSLGLIYQLTGRLSESEREYRHAIELAHTTEDVNEFGYRTDLGKVLLLQGRLDECESLLLSELSITQDGPGLEMIYARYHLLARLYRVKGDTSSSIYYYRKTIRAICDAQRPTYGVDQLIEEMAALLREDASL